MNIDTLVRPLASADDRCGGKAAGLAVLVRAGAPVPSGGVIDTRAFDDHLVRCGASEGIRGVLLSEARPERLAAIRAAILSEPLAPELREALRRVHERKAPGVHLAVRSSAIGEDGRETSFAGQFASVLGVDSLDAMETAVRDVWASAFGDRVLQYFRHRHAAPAGMAVVIQEQVDAIASGVLFTRDPGHAAGDDLLMEYCEGLGEALVAGAITPGRARISRDGNRVTVEQRHEGDCFDPCHHPAVRALARHAEFLERSLGAPQDIEWSIDRAGRHWLLQCRPVTAMRQAARREVWSNANIAENFPGPVTPLLASFVARGYAAYFRGLGKAFGIAPRRMEVTSKALDGLVGVQAGRLYYNLSNIHAVLHLAPCGAWLARSFNAFTGAEDTPELERVSASLAERLLEAGRIAVKVPWQYARVQQRVARFERTVDAYATATQPERLAHASLETLAAHLRGFLDVRLHRWTDAALADTAAMVCYGTLKALLERWLPGSNHCQLHNDLLQGLPGLASAAPVERLWALAKEARRDSKVRAILGAEPATSVRTALERAHCTEFLALLDHYLERWGFRYSGELMLTQPTPAEDPTTIIRLLQTYLRADGRGPGEISGDRAAARLAATARVERLLTPLALLRRLPSQAAAFRIVLAATHGAIRLRERARMKQALLYTRLRHVALALGDRLVADGRLAQRDDVFFLTIDEAIDLSCGARSWSLADTVTERRAAYEAAGALTPPDRLVLAPGTSWSDEALAGALPVAAQGDSLRGVGACGGLVTGAASVVLDVTEAERLAEGAILVTRQTDPGWAALFFLVKGLVVERGGMLSHGAIIAREYGIPAVVGVRDATRLIRDGDQLRVNGDAGTVELQHA